MKSHTIFIKPVTALAPAPSAAEPDRGGQLEAGPATVGVVLEDMAGMAGTVEVMVVTVVARATAAVGAMVDETRSQSLMVSVDALNRRYGRGTVA